MNILDKKIQDLEKEEYTITQEMVDNSFSKMKPLIVHNIKAQKVFANINKNLVGRKIQKGENLTKIILESAVKQL